MVYENVAREVRRRKILQEDLAKGTGISQSKISMTLSGKRKMTPEELFKYCRFLGKDPDYFSDDKGPKEETCKIEEAEDPGEGSSAIMEKV